MSSQSAIHNPKLELPTLRIAPSKGWVPLKLKDLWEYRELLYFLIWRDIKVRYKQTALGATWAIIQPFFTMVVFSIFFGHLANVLRDAPAVAFTPRERAQEQHVESPLDQLAGRLFITHRRLMGSYAVSGLPVKRLWVGFRGA